jgi:hypothetical protein
LRRKKKIRKKKIRVIRKRKENISLRVNGGNFLLKKVRSRSRSRSASIGRVDLDERERRARKNRDLKFESYLEDLKHGDVSEG